MFTRLDGAVRIVVAVLAVPSVAATASAWLTPQYPRPTTPRNGTRVGDGRRPHAHDGVVRATDDGGTEVVTTVRRFGGIPEP